MALKYSVLLFVTAVRNVANLQITIHLHSFQTDPQLRGCFSSFSYIMTSFTVFHIIPDVAHLRLPCLFRQKNIISSEFGL